MAFEQTDPDLKSKSESIASGSIDQPPIEKPGHDASAIPNGGLQAWLQVAGAWVLMFNTFGLINTFGVYTTYYESGQLFQTSSSNIAWIGAIQAYCIMLIGTLTGPIFDAGYFRALIVSGSFLVVFGHMMLSLCHTFWQTLLAQGFVIGLGSGLLFVPSIAIMPAYFSTNVGTAIGIAVSGSSFGGVIYPIAFYRLIQEVGFGWSVRILGFIALAMLILPISVMRMRVKPAQKRALIDLSAFTDWSWLTFVLSAMVGFIGVYVVIFYLSFFAGAAHITSAEMAFYLVPVLNAGSLVGRTVPNYFSDKIGPLNIMGPCTVVVSILTLCLIAVKTQGAIIAVAFLYGAFSGVFFALPPVVFVKITDDKAKIGTRIGMGFTIMGLGSLAGGPGGGAVLGTVDIPGAALNFRGLWIYGGICALVSGFALIGFRFARSGLKLAVKV